MDNATSPLVGSKYTGYHKRTFQLHNVIRVYSESQVLLKLVAARSLKITQITPSCFGRVSVVDISVTSCVK